MKIPVTLTLKGIQTYHGQEPDVIELVTDGILEQKGTHWELSYEESSLTGLEGVTTSFLLQDHCVTLTRSGNLQSQMVFQEGTRHESLYQMEFGAFMMTVCASLVQWEMKETGGTVKLQYKIEIEQDTAGTVDYDLKVKAK